MGEEAAPWVPSEHPFPGEGGSRCPSRADGSQTGAVDQPGRSVPKKQAEKVLEGNSPQDGCLALGTEEEPLLPVSSSGTSCTVSSTAQLSPMAPWGTVSRTPGLALLCIWWAWGRRTFMQHKERFNSISGMETSRCVIHLRPPPGTGYQLPENPFPEF